MMRITTSAEVSVGAPDRWRKQYSYEGRWAPIMSGDSESIYAAILAASGDPEKIAAAIGNKGWSFVYCSSCRNYVHIAAQFGEDELQTILCQQCLISGAAALEAVARFVGGAR